MDTSFILNLLSELAYLLIVFGVMWFIAVFRGRQAIINLIFGLYLALLISIEFPYYQLILGSGEGSNAVGQLIAFAVFTLLSTWLFARVMPDEFQETKLETMHKKLLLAASATVIVMIFSFNVLPVTEFLTPGTPIQSIFGPQNYFFGWLMLPLVILFFI
jgi:hydrogenase-4 membrane subunit HyfE